MRITTIVGARPQFIKAAVISRAIRNNPELGLVETIIHTGQHFDSNMSDVFFDELDIPKPGANLSVGGGSHGAATGAMLAKIEEAYLADRPDMVLVYGDTNSTLAGALAAAKLHIPVAHVEAGLRSFNRDMPEEVNRVLTDHMSNLLFCPSSSSKDQLASEGVTDGVHVAGDVMFDAVCYYKGRASATAPVDGAYAMATIHRAENTDNIDRLRGIFDGMKQCPLPIVLPLHPRTKNAIAASGIELPSNISIIDPVGYLEMIALVRDSSFVLTDSGGLQKEAFFLGQRCITMRDETEWTELVDCGVNRLVGADSAKISASFDWALTPMNEPEQDLRRRIKRTKNLLGNFKIPKFLDLKITAQ